MIDKSYYKNMPAKNTLNDDNNIPEMNIMKKENEQLKQTINELESCIENNKREIYLLNKENKKLIQTINTKEQFTYQMNN